MSEFPLPNVSTDLSGQVAFVTGTTSGLGKRFAKVLAACASRANRPPGRTLGGAR